MYQKPFRETGKSLRVRSLVSCAADLADKFENMSQICNSGWIGGQLRGNMGFSAIKCEFLLIETGTVGLHVQSMKRLTSQLGSKLL